MASFHDRLRDYGEREGGNKTVRVKLNYIWNISNGKVVWKDTGLGVSSRWLTPAIVQQLGFESVSQLIAKGNIPEKPINMLIPPKLRRVGTYLGNFFEACFWEEVSIAITRELGGNASINPPSGAWTSGGLADTMTITKYDTKYGSVEVKAKNNFKERLNESWLTQSKLTPGEIDKIKSTAKSAAVNYVASISDMINRFKKAGNGKVEIEAVAGSAPKGDVIIKFLNEKGQTFRAPAPPVLELKYYSKSSVTFWSPSDSNLYFKLTQYLQTVKKETDWNHSEDTALWLSGLRGEGIPSYMLALAAAGDKNGEAQDQAFFNYLLGKGKHHFKLAEKQMIVVNSSTGKITITLDLKTLSERQADKDVRFEVNGTKGIFYNGNGVSLGGFAFDEQQTNLENWSQEYTNKVKRKKDMKSAYFNFRLNQGFYGEGAMTF